VNRQYEDLLHQYGTGVTEAEVSVSAMDGKVSADSVDQLTQLLHDSEVGHIISHCSKQHC